MVLLKHRLAYPLRVLDFLLTGYWKELFYFSSHSLVPIGICLEARWFFCNLHCWLCISQSWLSRFKVVLPDGSWKAFYWSNYYFSQVFLSASYSVLASGRRGVDHHYRMWGSLYLQHLLNIYKGLSEMESELMTKKQMSKKWWMRWIEILEKNSWDFSI